jgi:hypothetical protein
MTLSSLSLDQIAQRCAEETQKFHRDQLSDPAYCFELFRRALAEGVQEAVRRVYDIYERQLYRWVQDTRGFERTHESPEYFVLNAFSRFYFALRGPKFAGFSELPKVLAYMKVCVYTTIAQYLRDEAGHTVVKSIEDEDVRQVSIDPDPTADLMQGEIWARICELLPDERDQLLARCRFILEMKPNQIVVQYPQFWRTEREVSTALYRIRQRLRGDPGLRNLLGGGDPP